MQEIVYHSNFEIEEKYFWFLARNKIITKIINQVTDLNNNDQVIDIGCGTGGFAKILSQQFAVTCLDMSPIALDYCSKRGLTDLHNCILKDFDKGNRSLKAAFMLDVIEHIDDDIEVVSQVYDLLETNGWFIATVPAYQWLWSNHDEVHQHKRRYTMKKFNSLISNAGFEINYSTYFNSFLFLPAVTKRAVDGLKGSKNKLPVDEVSPLLNSVFNKIFSFESTFLPFIKFPFGLSILIVAKKL